jgi:hypothetical protein
VDWSKPVSDSEAEVERPETERFASGSRKEPDGEIILDDPIIDLTDPEATWERVEKDLNPFERLDKPARMRLMIRVLCELVAFDELEDEAGASTTAGTVETEKAEKATPRA